MGKKTPPKRKSGVTRKRPINAKLLSVRRVAVQARIGEANASKVRTEKRIASTASQEWTVPKANMPRKNATLPGPSRRACQPNSQVTPQGVRRGIYNVHLPHRQH